MMRNSQILLMVAVITAVLIGKGSEGATTADQMSADCAESFNTLTTCLTFATGKADAPTKECCSSVKTIKDSKPKCLCYIIQQTHNGSDAIKSLGVQESKLLELQSACQLQNASVSFCPKLLGLAPGSADAAIFGNSSSSSSSPATATPSTATTASPDKTDKNSSSKHGPYHIMAFIAMAIIVLFGFPTTGLASMCV